jgi:CBS domain containing-hemolysin-like protein
MVFMLVSTEIVGRTGLITAFSLLAVFIIIGILFDIIGIAVMSANETPFHSMASKRERGAAESIRLIKSAEKVATLCNDVIGDVTGIISGTTAAMVTVNLMLKLNTENILFQLLILGLVTGLTIGGKSIGKVIAIRNSTAIVHRVGILISLVNFKK